jgi:Protein of unknown function (DUF3987)/RepB DNA-primase from phage plasmid
MSLDINRDDVWSDDAPTAEAEVHPLIKLDRHEAKRFLDALVGGDSSYESFCFQTADEDKSRKNGALANHHTGPLAKHAGALERLNQRGAAVWVTINRTDGKGREKQNITAVRATFTDLDGAPIEPVQHWTLKPHIVVESSPSRYHAYYRHDGTVTLEAFTTIQLKLATLFNGDPRVHDLPRVMRLPGAWHMKGEPFQTRIVSIDRLAPAYSLADFQQALADVEIPDGAPGQGKPKGERKPREQLRAAQWINQEALHRIKDWAPHFFPGGRWSGSAWRLSPDALGRTCEEDLAIHPDGIRDFGQEWGDRVAYTPIRLLMAFFNLVDGELELAEFDDCCRPSGTVTYEQAGDALATVLGMDWKALQAEDDTASGLNAHDANDDEWDDPVDRWANAGAPGPLAPNTAPKIVEDYGQDRGNRLGVEAGAVVAATLTALGSLIPAGNELQMRQFDPHWKVKAILWLALVGDPSSNKSATINAAVAPVRHVEAGWRRDYARAKRAEAAAEQKAAEGDGAAAAENADDVWDKSEPRFRRQTVNDVTVEALQKVLSENPDGVLYLNDELASLFGSMDAYRQRAGKDRPFWLQAKEGGPYTVDRATKAPMFIPNTAASILGGIQPDKIKKLIPELASDGMLQRFQTIMLQRTGDGEDMMPNEKLDTAINELAESLAGAPSAGLYRFAPEAAGELAVIQAFRAKEAKQHDGPLAEWLGKLPNEYGRLALTFHFLEWYSTDLSQLLGDDPPPELISLATAQRARRFLTDFAFPHTRAFYSQRTANEQHADWIAEFILARGLTAITAREIYRAYPALRKKREQIPAAMQRLIADAWVHVAKCDRRSGTPIAWIVNPKVHDGRFADVAAREAARREAVREDIGEQARQAAGGAKVSPSVT